jgi:hypothetical protein
MRNIRPSSKEGGVPDCFAIPNDVFLIFLINVPVKIASMSPKCPKKVHTLRYLCLAQGWEFECIRF